MLTLLGSFYQTRWTRSHNPCCPDPRRVKCYRGNNLKERNIFFLRKFDFYQSQFLYSILLCSVHGQGSLSRRSIPTWRLCTGLHCRNLWSSNPLIGSVHPGNSHTLRKKWCPHNQMGLTQWGYSLHKAAHPHQGIQQTQGLKGRSVVWTCDELEFDNTADGMSVGLLNDDDEDICLYWIICRQRVLQISSWGCLYHGFSTCCSIL